MDAAQVAALQQQMAQMLQAHQQQAQQMQQLQAQVVAQQQLQQQAALASPPPPTQLSAAAAASAAVVPAPPAPRIAAAPLYHGAAGAAFDTWLREMNQQIKWYQLAAGPRQVAFAETQLRGPALDWWQSLTEERREELRVGANEFGAALRERFQPVSSAQTARAQLDRLRQGPHQSVNEYIAAFRRLLTSVPNMGEEDRLHRFLTGLRPTVQTQLRVQGVATVDAAITMASRIGALGEFTVAGHGPHGNPAADSSRMQLDSMQLEDVEGLEQETGAAEGSGSGASNAHARQLAALQAQINALTHARFSKGSKSGAGAGKRGPPRVNGLSDAQVKRNYDSGACFACGSKEHQYRHCPQRGEREQGN